MKRHLLQIIKLDTNYDNYDYYRLRLTIHSPNVRSMLVHRLRRWPNIDLTLGECLMFFSWELTRGHGVWRGSAYSVSVWVCLIRSDPHSLTLTQDPVHKKRQKDAGSASQTLAQHPTGIVWTSRVCWVEYGAARFCFAQINTNHGSWSHFWPQ